MRLTHSLTKAIYEADGWRWTPKSKRQVLADPATRFLLALDGPNNSIATPQAYLAFRFEEEAGHAVLYVYELQLSPSVQRRGLGRFLMQLAELLACRYARLCVHFGFDNRRLQQQASNWQGHAYGSAIQCCCTRPVQSTQILRG